MSKKITPSVPLPDVRAFATLDLQQGGIYVAGLHLYVKLPDTVTVRQVREEAEAYAHLIRAELPPLALTPEEMARQRLTAQMSETKLEIDQTQEKLDLLANKLEMAVSHCEAPSEIEASMDQAEKRLANLRRQYDLANKRYPSVLREATVADEQARKIYESNLDKLTTDRREAISKAFCDLWKLYYPQLLALNMVKL